MQQGSQILFSLCLSITYYRIPPCGQRDLPATIHRNLDFVTGVVTKNARLNEADSKAAGRSELRITCRYRCAPRRIELGKMQDSPIREPRDSRDGHRFQSLHRPARDRFGRNHFAVLPDLAVD